jgi:universal stress protein A
MRKYQTFLVPYDFSEHAQLALDTARDLARHFKADLHLVHVIQPPIYATPGFGEIPVTVLVDMREALLGSLRKVADGISDPPGRVETHVLEGLNIATLIDQCAEKIGADLIVMGTHGRTGLKHAFMGSVAERTLRSAPCPVLTVRATEDA